jgi:mannose-6-phosphate isomerase-like protein (cupin superfamily)
MADEHLGFQARRVISGVSANGKSTIVTDENTVTRTATPGFTVADVWRLDALPAHVDDCDTGMHTTETIDVVTMLSGELYAVLEDTETLLRPGDTLIQRGTKHSWSNRTDKPAIFVATMMPAKR